MKNSRVTLMLAALLAATACGGSKKPAADPSGEGSGFEGSETAEGASDEEGEAKPAEGAKKKPAEKKAEAEPKAEEKTAAAAEEPAGEEAPAAAGKKPGKKKAEKGPCISLEFNDLAQAVAQAECEVNDFNPDQKAVDIGELIDIKVVASPNVVKPGGHADISVVITNKSKKKVPLYWAVDPEPRFSFEAYNGKGVRADAPAGNEPPLPAEVANTTAPDRKISRIKLPAAGVAKMTIGWDAVKYKWASKTQAKGALPGHGYPKVPGGSLAKGKYRVKLVMPLVGVVEGVDHEVSAPAFQIEVK